MAETSSRQETRPDHVNVQSDQPQRKSNKLPDFLLSVRLKYVKLGYHYLISNAMYLLLIPLLGVASAHLSTMSPPDLVQLWNHLKFNLVSTTLCCGLIVFLGTLYFMSRPRKVYLVNFSCYKPQQDLKVTRELFMERSGLAQAFTEENLAFQKKILERSGLGQDTYLPPAVLRLPPNPCMEEARKEAEVVMFGAIDELLAKTGVKAKDIGILIVNCSLFNPTPSLSAMIVNHYKLRGNILSYNLGGMGCSAGLISIDLAKQLLQVCFRFFSGLIKLIMNKSLLKRTYNNDYCFTKYTYNDHLFGFHKSQNKFLFRSFMLEVDNYIRSQDII